MKRRIVSPDDEWLSFKKELDTRHTAPIPFPDKKYQIIYADPPWAFSSGIRSSKKINDKYLYYTPDTTVGGGKYKSVMRDTDILSLPVSSISDDSCVLFLWTTDAHLPLALQVMDAWGMPYKTVGFVWNKKERSGKQVCYYGKWTMKGTELCLIGAKGKANSLIQSHKVRGLVEACRGKHSEKPDEVRSRIVTLMGDIPRIELFARQHTEGWDVWGNEV
jgi:N6-adenosine-specific RNA methylase IME4